MNQKTILTFVLTISILAIPVFSSAKTPVSTTIGMEYRSEYFWRGLSFYGNENASRGVIFPYISQKLGDFGVYVGGEIATAALEDQASVTEEQWYGVDFILSYSKSFFNNNFKVSLNPGFYWYPNSPAARTADDYNNSFFDVAVSFQLPRVFLKPTLSYSQYLRIDDFDGTRENLLDIYVKLSGSHTFKINDNFSTTVGGSIAYFYYPSSEEWNQANGDDFRGLSDIVLYTKLNVSINKYVALYASFNIGIVPDEDFYAAWGGEDILHLFSKFGITYTPYSLEI